MVQLNNAVKQEYPAFSHWLYHQFSHVKHEKKVWSAFLKWSGLGRSASIYVGSGSVPEVRVEPLHNAQGEFRPKDGDVIYLDSQVVGYFEQNSKAKMAKILVESTILHEMCHWARKCGVVPVVKDGYGKGHVERGKHFEVDAYGGDVCFVPSKHGGGVAIRKFKQST